MVLELNRLEPIAGIYAKLYLHPQSPRVVVDGVYDILIREVQGDPQELWKLERALGRIYEIRRWGAPFFEEM